MNRSLSLLVLVLLVAGCSVNPAPASTAVGSLATQPPTWTVQPTYTPNATYTPFPTWTAVPTNAATSTPAATATPTPVVYTVQPGDSLNQIAKRFQLTPAAIASANNIQNSDIITVGSVLVIPVSSSTVLTATVAAVAAKPVVKPVIQPAAPPAAPAAPAAQHIYPAPQVLYPSNGTTLVYDAKVQKGTDDITFAWLPVGSLERGTQPCSWPTQPNGTEGRIWDRYQIEFNPGVPDWSGRLRPVMHNDQGLNRTFSLLEFKPGVQYSWHVVVSRWCVLTNYDNQDPKHQAMLGLVSPYSPLYTFIYTIP